MFEVVAVQMSFGWHSWDLSCENTPDVTTTHHRCHQNWMINTFFLTNFPPAYLKMVWCCLVNFPVFLTLTLSVLLQPRSLGPWKWRFHFSLLPSLNSYCCIQTIGSTTFPLCYCFSCCRCSSDLHIFDSCSSFPWMNLRLLYQAGWPTWITIVC